MGPARGNLCRVWPGARHTNENSENIVEGCRYFCGGCQNLSSSGRRISLIRLALSIGFCALGPRLAHLSKWVMLWRAGARGVFRQVKPRLSSFPTQPQLANKRRRFEYDENGNFRRCRGVVCRNGGSTIQSEYERGDE